MPFTFISVGSDGLPQSAERSLVRSHCMRGRNKCEDSRRSRQARRREARRFQSSAASAQELPPEPGVAAHTEESVVTSALVECAHVLPLTVFSPDVVLAELAGSPGRGDRELLYKYNALKDTIYPITHLIDFERTDNCHNWLRNDEALVHSILLASSAIQDFSLGRQPNPTTRFHLWQTISRLSASLSGEIRNATIYVVLNLCLAANVLGDTGPLGVHITGLQRIITVCGGSARPLGSKLRFKMDRLELSDYIDTGAVSHGLIGPFSWLPLETRARPRGDHVDQIRDERLIAVFRDLQYLCSRINQSSIKRLSGRDFREELNSIQTRLLHLPETAVSEPSEHLRLGMLAFLSTTLCIPGRRLPSVYLSTRLRAACQAAASPQFELWVLVVGVISVFEPSESWFRAAWTDVVGPDVSWEDVRGELRSVMWIDRMHDKPAREAFDVLNGSQSGESGVRSELVS